MRLRWVPCLVLPALALYVLFLMLFASGKEASSLAAPREWGLLSPGAFDQGRRSTTDLLPSERPSSPDVSVASVEVVPVCNAPDVVNHTVIHYPPFVLLPQRPLQEVRSKRILPPEGSLAEWYDSVVNCSESDAVCRDPSQFVSQFSTRYDPDVFGTLKGGPSGNAWVFSRTRMLTGHVHVLRNFTSPIFINCGWNQDQLKVMRDFSIPWKLVGPRSVHLRRSEVKVLELDGPLFYGAVEGVEQFQHFIIDAIGKLVQGWDFLQDPKVYVSTRQLDATSPLLYDLLELFHVNRSRILNVITLMDEYHYTAIRAPLVYLSCQAPFIHPYLFQRARRLLGLPRPSSLGQNLIIYLPRRNAKVMKNGGRRVINENEVLGLLRTHFSAPYEVVEFDSGSHRSLSTILELFGRAALVIGSHGGAFCNIFFAPSSTVVVEFFPAERQFWAGPFRVFWNWLADMQNQPYTCLLMESQGNLMDLMVDIESLRQTLIELAPLIPKEG